ncbi:TetR/AcrR family transcriptional regulator, partial [Cellulomonas triticagri]
AAAEQEGEAAGEVDALAGLPPAMAVLWRPAPAGRRGPRPGLTVAGITEAAVALADADGIAAISMARVAERLGVTTMALYRYVPGKDALLALMMESALADVVPAPGHTEGAETGGGWRPALERWCAEQLDLARRHPWAVDTSVVTTPPGPARVAFLDRGLQALAGTPLTWAERAAVVGRLSLHVLTEGQMVAAEVTAERMIAQAAAASATEGEGDPAPAHPALMDFGALLGAVADPGQHPELARALAAGAFDESSPVPGEGDDPDLGLRLLLDGVAALVDRAGRRGA